MIAKKITSDSPAIKDYISVEKGGVTSFVPMDEKNADYAELMKLVEAEELVIENLEQGGNNDPPLDSETP